MRISDWSSDVCSSDLSNAGYTLDGVVQKMGDDQFQKMLDVHVVAPFRILRAAAVPIRLFAKQEAAAGEETFCMVVLISSLAGNHGHAGRAVERRVGNECVSKCVTRGSRYK